MIQMVLDGFHIYIRMLSYASSCQVLYSIQLDSNVNEP